MPQTFNVGSRSMFVTAVAWVFILLAIAAVLSALLRHAAADSVLASLPAPQGVARVLAAYLPWVMGAGAFLSIATLAAAIGLLKRLDWARRVFIGLLLVAIAANLAGLWLQHELVQTVVESALSRTPLPAPVSDVFGGFVTASRVMGVVVTLGICGLMGWIVHRLMSAAVRQEFA
jgi:hypothetical protein